jgi:hypothetical protein
VGEVVGAVVVSGVSSDEVDPALEVLADVVSGVSSDEVELVLDVLVDELAVSGVKSLLVEVLGLELVELELLEVDDVTREVEVQIVLTDL